MITEQHQRIAASYDAFHNQIPVLSDITVGFRFYEFNDLVSGHDGLSNSVFDIQCIGDLQYRFFLKPPTIDSYIEKNKAGVVSVSRSTRLDLWPIPFTEKNHFSNIRKLLLKLFAGERVLKVLKQRGRHLRVICPASEIGGKLVAWLPKHPNVRAIDFLINESLIDCSELWQA